MKRFPISMLVPLAVAGVAFAPPLAAGPEVADEVVVAFDQGEADAGNKAMKEEMERHKAAMKAECERHMAVMEQHSEAMKKHHEEMMKHHEEMKKGQKGNKDKE